MKGEYLYDKAMNLNDNDADAVANVVNANDTYGEGEIDTAMIMSATEADAMGTKMDTC